MPLGATHISACAWDWRGCSGCALPAGVLHTHFRSATVSGVCHAERVCPCCDQGALGDEYHVMFECPVTRAAREPFAHLMPISRYDYACI